MTKRRVLIVDDEDRFARFVKAVLERTGAYEVCAESHAARALQTAIAFKPEFIYMDISMPGTDGGTLVAQFKNEPALQNVPVVFLTGAASKEEVDRHGGIIGGRAFLAKPVKLDDLVATVERYLGSSSPA